MTTGGAITRGGLVMKTDQLLYPIRHPPRQMHPLAGARTTRLIGKESSSTKQTQGKILYYDLIICERDGREEYK